MIDHHAPIRDHMTSSPITIGRSQSLADAARRMHEHHIRHLPVLEGGYLFGILSERDIEFAGLFAVAYPRIGRPRGQAAAG